MKRKQAAHLLALPLILLLTAKLPAQGTESKPKRTVTGLPRYMTDSSQPIPDQLKVADAPSTSREVSCFVGFHEHTTMIDVVRKCGIPDEHQGSGIYIFVYDMADGSIVVVGTGDLQRLNYVDHIEKHKSTHLLETASVVQRSR